MPAFANLSEAQKNAIIAYLDGRNVAVAAVAPARSDDASRLGRRARRRDSSSSATSAGATRTAIRRSSRRGARSSAIDLNTGEYRWRITLGEHAAAEGARHPDDGHGAVRRPDRHGGRPRVHRRDDGRQVPRVRQGARARCCGSTQLPLPATRRRARIASSGKQYVVISSAGGKLGSPAGKMRIGVCAAVSGARAAGLRGSDHDLRTHSHPDWRVASAPRSASQPRSAPTRLHHSTAPLERLLHRAPIGDLVQARALLVGERPRRARSGARSAAARPRSSRTSRSPSRARGRCGGGCVTLCERPASCGRRTCAASSPCSELSAPSSSS